MNMIWRKRFTDCCEAIYREMGFSPPEMTHDDLLPLGMELEYAGLQFELVHFPSELPDRVLVSVSLVNLPDDNLLAGLKNILKKNLTLVRAHSFVFGLNSENTALKCLYYEELDQCNHLHWLERMTEVAKNSVEIKNNCFDLRKYNLMLGRNNQIPSLA